jgi:hypothetical protein
MSITRRSRASLAVLAAGMPLLAGRAAAAPARRPLRSGDALAIKQASADTSIRYSYHLDNADHVAMPNVFTPDGVREVLGRRHAGRKAIGDYWRERTQGWKPGETWRHIITNQLIEVIAPDRARGTNYFTIYKFDLSSRRTVASLAPVLLTRSSGRVCAHPARGGLLASRRI